MKLAINILGMGEVLSSTNADVINRATLCKKLGINQVALCRYEKQHGFKRAIKIMIKKKKLRQIIEK